MATEPQDYMYPEDIESQDDSQYVSHFIGHYWPLVLFGTLFLGTLCLPMIISGVLPFEGLAIIGFFLLAFSVALVIPHLTGLFLLLAAIIVIAAYPFFNFNTAGPALYIVFGYSAIAGLMFAVSKVAKTGKQQQEERKAFAKGLSVVSLADDSSDVQEEVIETIEPEKPKAKPVAFDLKIAASGVTILFGTESGNSEELANQAGDALKADGHAVQVLDNEKVDADHLKAFANVLVITSTWGDGDPPSNTVDMMEKLKSDGYKLDMKGSQFSVLSLGDTSYEQFCQCGIEFDTFFEKFGASRVYNRVDCDLDFEEPFQAWIDGVKASLKSAGLKTIPEYVEETEAEAVAA